MQCNESFYPAFFYHGEYFKALPPYNYYYECNGPISTATPNFYSSSSRCCTLSLSSSLLILNSMPCSGYGQVFYRAWWTFARPSYLEVSVSFPYWQVDAPLSGSLYGIISTPYSNGLACEAIRSYNIKNGSLVITSEQLRVNNKGTIIASLPFRSSWVEKFKLVNSPDYYDFYIDDILIATSLKVTLTSLAFYLQATPNTKLHIGMDYIRAYVTY